MRFSFKILPLSSFIKINIIFITFLIFFGNIITLFGLPKFIKFLHIPLLLFIYLLYIIIWTKYKIKTSTVVYLLLIFFFLIETFFSGLLNNVPFFNILLFFSLYMEPFIFLMILMDIFKKDYKFFIFFKKYFFILILIEIIFALIEIFLGLRSDDVKGTFLNTGGGSHVLGYILGFFILYLIFINKNFNKLAKIIYILLSILIIVFADAKQVLFGIIIVILFYGISNLFNIKKFIISFVLFFSFIYFILKFKTLIGLEGWLKYKEDLFNMYLFKFFVYKDLLNWNIISFLFGFGPTEVCSSFTNLYSKYKNIINFFGGEASFYGNLVFNINQNIYFSNTITGTSFFTIMTSSMALLTEVGIVGFVIYYFIYLFLYLKSLKEVKFLIIYILYLSTNLWWIELPDLMLPLISILSISLIEERNLKKIKK